MYLNHKCFKFLAKILVDFLNSGQKQSWEPKKFKCQFESGGKVFFLTIVKLKVELRLHELKTGGYIPIYLI
jgi:hypothetical protein